MGKTTGSAAPQPSAIKRILITHPAPPDETSPYHQLAKEFKLKFDFQPFIEIQGIATPEFRKQNINPLDFSSIIFTSKVSVDHFFRICKDLRVEMPPDTKYFCVSDATAKYLQKYITIRKRKLYVGQKSTTDLIDVVKKHATEKFLFPAGEQPHSDLTDFMLAQGYGLQFAYVYQTIHVNLRHLKLGSYQMLCFFSPGSIDALCSNHPDFTQGDTLVAVFGSATALAAEAAGLRVDIRVPQKDIPSMTMAIEHYLRG
ncbi:MAG: uroporphyrinogen-III synthase [Bacteroidia bacterium]|nr:uroporphyrinogen-III synthase [Bacteroidia bacterium]